MGRRPSSPGRPGGSGPPRQSRVLLGHCADVQVGGLQQMLRGLDAAAVDVVHDGLPCHPPEQTAEVVGRQIEPRRHIGEGEFLLIVRGEVGANYQQEFSLARCGGAVLSVALLPQPSVPAGDRAVHRGLHQRPPHRGRAASAGARRPEHQRSGRAGATGFASAAHFRRVLPGDDGRRPIAGTARQAAAAEACAEPCKEKRPLCRVHRGRFDCCVRISQTRVKSDTAL